MYGPFGGGPPPLAPEGGRLPGGALPPHVLELGQEPHDRVTDEGHEEVALPVLLEKSARHPFSPVCVDSTLPARAEPREQFKLARLARPQASTSSFVIFQFMIAAVAWSVQVYVLHQMPAERRASRLLNVQEHHD